MRRIKFLVALKTIRKDIFEFI